MTETLPINEIVVEDRYRQDYGDVESLAVSIATNGLLHPIVVDDSNVLIAGGRRLAAFNLLASGSVNGVDANDFRVVPITRFGQLDEAQRKLLEIEENVRRKETSWQEQVIGLYDYHRICERRALKRNEKWGQQLTADLLNIEQSAVSSAIRVAKILKTNPEDPIKDAANLSEALRILVSRTLDEAAKEQLRRIEAKRAELAKAPKLADAAVNPADFAVSKPVISAVENLLSPNDSLTTPKPEAKKQLLTKEQVASFYYHGNALELIPEIARKTVINHIICDPPFGIDMGNLLQSSVGRVAETHEVEPNKQLLKAFLDVAYSALASDGFLCFWYDLDHHEKLATWAGEAGFKVCRWPLVWCKTSPCQNQAAQYNITKATEVCYLLRKSEQSIIKQKQPKNFILESSCATPSHPFVKPFNVWKYLLETVSVEGQTILDPFAGEGSSLAAAFRVGRNPIGIELDNTHIANGLSYVSEQVNGSLNSSSSTAFDSLNGLPDADIPL